MNHWMYRITQAFCVVLLLGSEAVLSFILLWLIKGHGIIACGKGIFESPTWFFAIVLLIGVPITLMIGAGWVFTWCSNANISTKAG